MPDPTAQPTRLVEWLTAFGTIGAVVVALFGEWIKKQLFGPRLTIEVVPEGTPLPPNRTFYHFLVKNLRPSSAAINVRVVLREVHRQKGSSYYPIHLAYPPMFRFPGLHKPDVYPPPPYNVTHEQTIDFGALCQEKFEKQKPEKDATIPDKITPGKFEPMLYQHQAVFPGNVEKGETVRYHVEVVADNFRSSKFHVFQVYWDGTWNAEPNLLRDKRHLIIERVEQTQ